MVQEQFTIYCVSATWANVLVDVSDEVRGKPSATFWALSNGPTFKTIGALVPQLFAIQSVLATWANVLVDVSDEVRGKPSVASQALLNGPTFKAIGAAIEE